MQDLSYLFCSKCDFTKWGY